ARRRAAPIGISHDPERACCPRKGEAVILAIRLKLQSRLSSGLHTAASRSLIAVRKPNFSQGCEVLSAGKCSQSETTCRISKTQHGERALWPGEAKRLEIP